MSRYALEWAKQARTESAAARVVLLLLADRAEGREHAAHYYVERLAREACLSVADLEDALEELRVAALITSQEAPHGAGRVENPWSHYLLIPERWITPTTSRPKRAAAEGDRPTAVYRLYDTAGELLYVGIGVEPMDRLDQHRRSKRWWHEVARHEIAWYASRLLAGAEECRAVAFDKPKYNIDHATSGVHGFTGQQFSVVDSWVDYGDSY